MDKEQRLAVELVITLCEADDGLRRQTESYGDWFNHMIDHLADLDDKRSAALEYKQ